MNLFAYLRNRFLEFFGDIKVFKFPFFLLYDPGSYKVKGFEIRYVIDNIQPGDIVVRGYSNYLDGFFIPGFFSHTGLFLGETHKGNLLLPDVIESKFYEGKQVVIHSMAEGVFMEDIINFCKCDYLLILRRSTEIESSSEIDSSFTAIYENALKNLGKGYDFKFDFSNIHNLSCTELVYTCCIGYLSKYNVKIKQKRVFLKKRQILIPDDFVTKQFKVVFKSRSIQPEKLNKIMQKNSAS
ncbi:MAG: YiiX/YebB-like N1pC/P60 family cysteine hydrolase [Saprospiraceae bacterium]